MRGMGWDGMGCDAMFARPQSTPTATVYPHLRGHAQAQATPSRARTPKPPPLVGPWGHSGSLGPLDLDLGRLNQSSVRHLLPYPALCMAPQGPRNTRTETRSGCWLWVMTAWTAWLRRGLRREPRLSYRNEGGGRKNGCRRCSCIV